jgi:hypothetical protein
MKKRKAEPFVFSYPMRQYGGETEIRILSRTDI